MPSYSIARLLDGKYKLVRRGSSQPLSLGRLDLEHFLKDGTIIGSTIEEVLKTLDQTGSVELTMTE